MSSIISLKNTTNGQEINSRHGDRCGVVIIILCLILQTIARCSW